MGNDNKDITNGNRHIETIDNLQRYILGSKKSGTPRAVYDVIRDFVFPSKKKKKRKKKSSENNTYSLYLKSKKNKGKKKKKKDKHWKF